MAAPYSAISWDNFWLFPKGGAAVQDGNDWHVAWWGSSFPNLVQRLAYADAASAPTSLWSSTGTGNGSPPPTPQVIGGSGSQAGVTLRTSVNFAEVMNLQTLRLGKVIPGNANVHPVVFGTGGRVIVLDGTNGQILAQSEDLGFGGMALGIADLTGDGVDEILCAPAVAPIDATPPPSPHTSMGHMRAYVHVLQFAASPNRLVRLSTMPIGDPYGPDDLHGYGACGLAIADLDFPANGVPEVIVTTLNGEFVVFGQSNGVLNPTPRFRTIVEGQLGAFNSIVVGDFDPQINAPGKLEVYLASTTGIRKFFFP